MIGGSTHIRGASCGCPIRVVVIGGVAHIRGATCGCPVRVVMVGGVAHGRGASCGCPVRVVIVGGVAVHKVSCSAGCVFIGCRGHFRDTAHMV